MVLKFGLWVTVCGGICRDSGKN